MSTRNLESWLGGDGLVGEWVVTTSPTNNISLLATALAVLSLFMFSSISLRIAFTVSDACQRENLEWLDGNGLVSECGLFVSWWVRTTPPTNNISLLSHARQRKNLVLRWMGVCAGVGGVG